METGLISASKTAGIFVPAFHLFLLQWIADLTMAETDL